MIWEKVADGGKDIGTKWCTVDLKRCSNYRLHYEFVICCLDALRPAFHGASGESACCFFSFRLISAGGQLGSVWRWSPVGGTSSGSMNKSELWRG